MAWFRFRHFPRHLPVASGPHVPGCKDVMLGYGKQSLFVRLYYPTSSEKNLEENSRKWIAWVTDYRYMIGVSKLLAISLRLLQIINWLFSVYSADGKSSVHVPVLFEEIPNTSRKLKCIIISHGLGGTRFFYSKLCYDLASYGFLVAAMEHRDSSCCYTYSYFNENDAKSDVKTPMEYRHIPLGEKHYGERHRQIEQRTDECIRTMEFLRDLNGGHVPKNLLGCSLKEFVGNLDLDDLVVMGHSFGAATALNAAATRDEFKCCVLLDPWMFPIKDEGLDMKVKQPAIFINTQTFHVKPNVKVLAKFLKGENREMFTLKRTTHEAQTDSILIFGSWLNLLIRKLNPLLTFQLNNNLILSFLSRHIGFPNDVSQEKMHLEEHNGNIIPGLTKPWK